MFIEPSTDVYILKNCPLESSYDHSIIFDSPEKQEAYFLSIAKFHPTEESNGGKATYQRVNLNSMKVKLPVEKLYDCNYMMFKNEYFENKWFYAFITSVDYVNNRTCLITYYIDVIQTWLFEAELQQCFVEREHVTDDRIGANTVPENVDMGDSVIYHYMDKVDGFSWNPNDGNDPGDYLMLIVTAFDDNGNKNVNGAGLFGGVYSGLNYVYFESVEQATAFIEGVVANSGEDAVIAMYMVPRVIATVKDSPISKHYWAADVSYASSWQYMWENTTETPRNNKLYTYPFTTILCNNMVGGTIEYKVEDLCWEATEGSDEYGDITWVDKETYLDTKKQKFFYRLEGIAGAPPKALMMPCHYAGQKEDRNRQLTIDNFPQCAFITDSYRAWVAMNYRSLNMQTGSSVISGIAGALGGAITGRYGEVLTSLTSPLGVIGTNIAERETMKIVPDKAHGMTAPDLAMANDSLGFRFYCAHIRPEIAKRLDDYFDRYGYQVNVNKIPNRKARKHWSYVKTANCTLTGDLPDDDKQKIIAVYNRGITFWVKPEEVGNYSLNNNEGVLREATTEPQWETDPEYIPNGMYGYASDDGRQYGDPNNENTVKYYFYENVITQEKRQHNVITAYRYLRDHGWSHVASVGAIANMDYYSKMVDPAYNSDGRYGLLMWGGDEKEDLKTWQNSNGYPKYNGVGQITYLDKMTDANAIWDNTDTGYDYSFSDYKKLNTGPEEGPDEEECAYIFYRCYKHGTGGPDSEHATSIKNEAVEDLQIIKASTYYKPDVNEELVDPDTDTGSSSIDNMYPLPRFNIEIVGDMPEEDMENNAYAINILLNACHWSKNAIYAVLGNWDVTSQLNPISNVKSGIPPVYRAGNPIGFSHWTGQRLTRLMAYLMKYEYYVGDGIEAPEDVGGGYYPEIEEMILHNDKIGLGMVLYLIDKGGTSLEWVKADGHNMSFDNFKKNTTSSLDWMTETFEYNHIRNVHTESDTQARKDAARKWKQFFENR